MGHKEHQSSPEQKMLLSNRLLKKNPNHPPNANMYKEGIMVAPDRNFVKCQFEMLKWLQQKKKKVKTMLDPSKSHPGFPSRKETAQIFRVHGLLYEEVHLPSHTEHCSLLHTLQLLLQSHQNTLSHLVKTLVIAAGRIKKEKQGL